MAGAPKGLHRAAGVAEMVKVGDDLLAAIGGLPAATSPLVVEAEGIHKWFGRQHALKGVSLTVSEMPLRTSLWPNHL